MELILALVVFGGLLAISFFGYGTSSRESKRLGRQGGTSYMADPGRPPRPALDPLSGQAAPPLMRT